MKYIYISVIFFMFYVNDFIQFKINIRIPVDDLYVKIRHKLNIKKNNWTLKDNWLYFITKCKIVMVFQTAIEKL